MKFRRLIDTSKNDNRGERNLLHSLVVYNYPRIPWTPSPLVILRINSFFFEIKKNWFRNVALLKSSVRKEFRFLWTYHKVVFRFILFFNVSTLLRYSIRINFFPKWINSSSFHAIFLPRFALMMLSRVSQHTT